MPAKKRQTKREGKKAERKASRRNAAEEGVASAHATFLAILRKADPEAFSTATKG